MPKTAASKMPGKLRFHLDESVTRRVAEGFRTRGIDCSSTPEEKMLGASDPEQLAFAKLHGRVIITCDADFLRMAQSVTDHSGIVFWLQHRHFGQLIRDIHAMSFEKSPENLHGRVVYIA